MGSYGSTQPVNYLYDGRWTPGMWMRIRHSSATNLIYYETSTNGTTWTSIYSIAPWFDITALKVEVAAGFWVGGQVAVTPAIYANVSLVHNAPVSPPPPPAPPPPPPPP